MHWRSCLPDKIGEIKLSFVFFLENLGKMGEKDKLTGDCSTQADAGIQQVLSGHRCSLLLKFNLPVVSTMPRCASSAKRSIKLEPRTISAKKFYDFSGTLRSKYVKSIVQQFSVNIIYTVKKPAQWSLHLAFLGHSLEQHTSLRCGAVLWSYPSEADANDPKQITVHTNRGLRIVAYGL